MRQTWQEAHRETWLLHTGDTGNPSAGLKLETTRLMDPKPDPAEDALLNEDHSVNLLQVASPAIHL